MVDQAILGSVMLGLEGPEQRLLRPQDLHRAGRVLRQRQQRAGMRNEARSHQLANERCEVGGNGSHSGLEVVVQLAAVVSQINDLRRRVGSMDHAHRGMHLHAAQLRPDRDTPGTPQQLIRVLGGDAQVLHAYVGDTFEEECMTSSSFPRRARQK